MTGDEEGLASFREYVATAVASGYLLDLTRGGTNPHPQPLTLAGTLGEPVNGYALDTLPVPFENPYGAWLRSSALAFFDGGRCVVATYVTSRASLSAGNSIKPFTAWLISEELHCSYGQHLKGCLKIGRDASGTGRDAFPTRPSAGGANGKPLWSPHSRSPRTDLSEKGPCQEKGKAILPHTEP